MKTEDIEYNGQVFSCRTIIDISSMVELLSLLAKRQKYLEDKINFQEERINDKDKRISELEIMIKGFSLSKEEKFPLEKEVPIIKKEIKNDLDEMDDLDAFLSKDNKNESRTIYIEKNKDENFMNDSDEVKTVKLEEKEEEKEEEKPEEKNEEKVEEKKEEKIEEKKEEKPVEKKEEKIEEKKEIKSDEDDNIKNKEEETEKKIDINLEQKQTPTIIKEKNLVETENKQISIPENTEKKEEHLDKNTNNNNQNIVQAQSSNSQTEEIIKKIIKRIKLLESKIDTLQQSELASKSQNITTEKAGKSRLETKVNLLNKKVEQIEDDQNKMKDEIAKIKEKTDDFNVYDLFKGNSGDTNIDATQGLIMALENKIFKKLIKYLKNSDFMI